MKSLFAVIVLFPIMAASYEYVSQSRPSLYGSSTNVTCPIKIVPHRSIGPIELGRHIKEIENLGMVIKSVQGSHSSLVVGRYSIGLDAEDRVNFIGAEIGDLPDCLFFNKKKISHKSSTKMLAGIFENCKKEEIMFGGNSTECDGVTIGIGGWGGKQKTPSLVIRKEMP